MRAWNRTRSALLMDRGEVAATAWSRFRGLLGHAPLEPGEGLVLRGEKAIHTLGMSFPIDVLFLDRTGRVVHLLHSIKPMRLSHFVLNAADVLELPPGTLERTETTLGDMIEFNG